MRVARYQSIVSIRVHAFIRVLSTCTLQMPKSFDHIKTSSSLQYWTRLLGVQNGLENSAFAPLSDILRHLSLPRGAPLL